MRADLETARKSFRAQLLHDRAEAVDLARLRLVEGFDKSGEGGVSRKPLDPSRRVGRDGEEKRTAMDDLAGFNDRQKSPPRKTIGRFVAELIAEGCAGDLDELVPAPWKHAAYARRATGGDHQI